MIFHQPVVLKSLVIVAGGSLLTTTDLAKRPIANPLKDIMFTANKINKPKTILCITLGEWSKGVLEGGEGGWNGVELCLLAECAN